MSFPFKKWVWLCWFKLSKHKGCSILTQPTFNLFKSFNKQHDLRMSNCVITRLWCTTWTLEYKRIEYWLLVAIHLDTSIWAFLQIAFPQINCQKVQIDKYTEANWWTAKTKIKRSLCVSNAVFNAIYRQNIKRCIFQSAETDLFHLKSSNQSGWLLSTTILLFDMVVFKFIVTKIICTCFIVSPYYKKAIVNAVLVLPERQQKQCRSNNHTAVLCHWPPAKLSCDAVRLFLPGSLHQVFKGKKTGTYSNTVLTWPKPNQGGIITLVTFSAKGKKRHCATKMEVASRTC